MRCPVPASRLCTSTTVVAAASPTIMRSKTGRPPRPRPGCLPRSAKKGTRRRISRTRRRSRLPLNASPPSDRPQQLVIVSSHAACPQPCSLVGGPAAAGLPAATPNATLVDIVHRRLDGGADGVFPVTRRSIAFPPCSIVDPPKPPVPPTGFFFIGNRNSGSIRLDCAFDTGRCRHMRRRNPRLGRILDCSGAAAAVHRILVADQHTCWLACGSDRGSLSDRFQDDEV